MADVLDDLFSSSGSDAPPAAPSAGPLIPAAMRAAIVMLLRGGNVSRAAGELRAADAEGAWGAVAADLVAMDHAAGDFDSAADLTAALAAARSVEAACWAALNAGGRWPLTALREANVFAAAAGAGALFGLRDQADPAACDAAARAAVGWLDGALVCGGPAQPLAAITRAVDAHVDTSPAGGAGAAGGSCVVPAALPPPAAVPLPEVRFPIAEQPLPAPADKAACEAFRRDHFATRRPVVLRGLAAGWPGLELWRDVGDLRRRFGHRVVPVEVGRHHDGQWQERRMTIGAFIDAFMAPSVERCYAAARREGPELTVAGGGLPPAETVGYVAQHRLAEQLPALRAESRPPVELCCACNGGRGVQRANAWLGTDGTVTPLHFDSYDNLLVQAVGFKYVRLYDVAQTDCLHLDAADAAESDAAAAGGSDAETAPPPRRPATTAQRNISPVDVERPDARRFPRFGDAPYTEAVLGPGDALFMPNGVWHYVRSLSPSFSHNFWF